MMSWLESTCCMKNHCKQSKQGKQLKAVVKSSRDGLLPTLSLQLLATRYMLKRFFTLPQPRVVGLSNVS